ncbi:hypothetical protein TKK_0013048 [Trichogramma kaykai]|uniref:Peptidase S1 domain-containing protein n=1 Tax=Trichogramma kaykai TaxID=54128 RepID=A0ABD2WIU9_9HYME
MKLVHEIVLVVLAIIGAVSAGRLSHFYKIAQGGVAPAGRHPYQCYLRFDVRGLQDDLLCGASVINDRYLLTAAHCADYNLEKVHMEVVCGATNRKNPEALGVYQVEQLIQHEGFETIKGTTEVAANDLALVRVSKPIQFSDKVRPIELATKPIAPRSQVHAVGYGFTVKDQATQEQLREVDLKVVDRETCQAKWTELNIQLRDGMLCVAGAVKEYGDKHSFKGMCPGDSGSSATANNVLVGIMSAGNACGDSYLHPNIFMDVSYYSDWIKATIKSNDEKFKN